MPANPDTAEYRASGCALLVWKKSECAANVPFRTMRSGSSCVSLRDQEVAAPATGCPFSLAVEPGVRCVILRPCPRRRRPSASLEPCQPSGDPRPPSRPASGSTITMTAYRLWCAGMARGVRCSPAMVTTGPLSSMFHDWAELFPTIIDCWIKVGSAERRREQLPRARRSRRAVSILPVVPAPRANTSLRSSCPRRCV